MISIKDIAEICRVSPMTVSRALNNSKEISKETKEKILKVCDEMGYRPNSAARSLVSNKTNMIGLIVPDITNQYYSYVSKGVSSYLEEHGYGLILCNSDRNRENEKRYMDFLTQRRVDGIILLPLSSKYEDYKMLTNTVPFVQVDNYINGLEASFIGNDNYEGSRKIVSHMLKQGYKRIGLILSTKNSTASNERFKGYVDVLEENCQSIDTDIIINTNATFEDGYTYAESLIKKKVDAIFAINDTVALGVIKYCYNNDIKLPQDLGVAGYDDIEQASMLPVPLTTIHQRKLTLGRTAASVLIEEINNNIAVKQKIILQPELIIRKSCNEK
jgi:LacI family transcriptional regulator